MNLKKELRKLLTENKDRKTKYGCLMAQLTIDKKKWNNIQSFIEDDELYEEEVGHGRENEPHVTILYGLHEDVEDSEIKKIVEEWESFPVKLKTVGLFENDKFDVIKFSITDKNLTKHNKEIKKFSHTNSYPDYKAHATIAYVKPGKGKEIVKRYKEYEGIELDCNKLKYSKSDGTKKYYKLKS